MSLNLSDSLEADLLSFDKIRNILAWLKKGNLATKKFVHFCISLNSICKQAIKLIHGKILPFH